MDNLYLVLVSFLTINNAHIEKILYLRFHIVYIYTVFHL